MARLADWEARLGAYLTVVRDRPHAYGEHDCALFAASVVEAMTGVDHGEPFRGRYSTELGAARALKTIGAGTLEATFDRHLPQIAPAFASRGDLVLVETAIGVCIGSEAMFVGQDDDRPGLVRLPRRLWAKAWKV